MDHALAAGMARLELIDTAQGSDFGGQVQPFAAADFSFARNNVGDCQLFAWLVKRHARCNIHKTIPKVPAHDPPSATSSGFRAAQSQSTRNSSSTVGWGEQ